MRSRTSVATVAVRSVAWVTGSALVAFLTIPVTLLVVAGASSARGVFRDRELIDSLALTFACATAATLIAVAGGCGIAYALARRAVPLRNIVAALIDVPLLIPHPVAGIAILLFVARGTPAGSALAAIGLRVIGTPAGIIAAMTFVSAPLFVSGAREAFARIDPRYELLARTLGDSGWSAFRRVTLPMALRGVLSAATLAWARSVSEFGAIVVLAYNPKVASVLSYERLTTGGLADALPVAATLVVVSLVPLIALRALRHERGIEDVR